MSSENSNYLDNINTKSTSDNPVLAARDAREAGADKSFHGDGSGGDKQPKTLLRQGF